MNYERIRQETKKKLEENKKLMSGLNGADREKLEQHIIKEASKEPESEQAPEPEKKKKHKA